MTYSENQAYCEIAGQLLSRLDYIRIQPKTILVIGFCAQNIKSNLQKRYPDSVIKNYADLSTIQKLENDAFDLIIAHFALLQMHEPLYLLGELFRALSDEGLLLLTSLGPDTFCELGRRFQGFVDMHFVGDWMRSAHFSDPVVDREEITLAYDNLNLLHDDLKNMGISISPDEWQKQKAAYEEFKTDDYFPATLEIIYGHGWKIKSTREDDALQSEVFISIDDIKKII